MFDFCYPVFVRHMAGHDMIGHCVTVYLLNKMCANISVKYVINGVISIEKDVKGIYEKIREYFL